MRRDEVAMGVRRKRRKVVGGGLHVCLSKKAMPHCEILTEFREEPFLPSEVTSSPFTAIDSYAW